MLLIDRDRVTVAHSVSHEVSGTIVPSTRCLANRKEAAMPVILWLLGVPLVVVVALMLTHVI
jgi:hypothetical protein